MPTKACVQQTSTSNPTSTQHPSIDQSVNASISHSRSVTQSISRSVAADRVVSCSGCRLSPPRSAPQPQVSTRWPGPPMAARDCCVAVLLPLCGAALRCAVRRLRLGLGRWAGAGRARAVWNIPGRVRGRGGLFTGPVFNELVVRGGDEPATAACDRRIRYDNVEGGRRGTGERMWLKTGVVCAMCTT